jgi:hypothetical protein
MIWRARDSKQERPIENDNRALAGDGDSADLASGDGRPSTYRGGLTSPTGRGGCFGNWSGGSQVMYQRSAPKGLALTPTLASFFADRHWKAALRLGALDAAFGRLVVARPDDHERCPRAVKCVTGTNPHPGRRPHRSPVGVTRGCHGDRRSRHTIHDN